MTLFLGFAAVNTGNNLLYLMVSALLGFMAISGLFGQKNLQRISVKTLSKEDLYAQLPGRLNLIIDNQRRWLAAFLISIEISEEKFLIPVLPAGQRHRISMPFTPEARGYQNVPAIWVRSRFPVNFFIRGLRLATAEPVMVYPQPQIAQAEAGTQGKASDKQQELRQKGFDGEMRSIDDYRSNDPIKAIHWKLSARHGDLKVRRHHRLGAPSLLLNPDDFSGTLEQRLGQCTFLINQAVRNGQAVGLHLGAEVFHPATGAQQRLKLLKELALYDQR